MLFENHHIDALFPFRYIAFRQLLKISFEEYFQVK